MFIKMYVKVKAVSKYYADSSLSLFILWSIVPPS